MAIALAATARADLELLRTYTAPGGSVGARVCREGPLNTPLELWILDLSTGEPTATAPVVEGPVDLGALFPEIWSGPNSRPRAIQLVEGGVPSGPAVIVEPLTPPRRATDGLTAALNESIESGDRARLLKLLAEPDSSRRALRQSVRLSPDSTQDPQPFALRTYTDEHIVLDTSAGQMELALHPEAAPRTCYHFLELVRGGFYEGTTFHRIVAADGRGRPFLIQGGDPIGTGAGGPGFAIDFEPSTLPHDLGVVSMARQPNDPNSAGSQFFICLSREACASLDGQYASFARVVRGFEVLSTLAITPVRTNKGEPGSGPGDRPVEAPVIRSARAIPAPPRGLIDRGSSAPILDPALAPVER